MSSASVVDAFSNMSNRHLRRIFLTNNFGAHQVVFDVEDTREAILTFSALDGSDGGALRDEDRILLFFRNIARFYPLTDVFITFKYHILIYIYLAINC